MNPKFTIVTVTYNNVSGLKRTAQSVLSQTFNDYEWIIIDGGSSDDTAKFISSIPSPSTRFISEPDDGIYDAMNKGIKYARGNYTNFMNAGDCFADDRVLASVNGCIGDDSPAIVYGDSYEEAGQARFYKRARSPRANVYSMFTHHQSIMYRTNTLKQLGYDRSYKLSCDWVLTTRILKQADEVVRFGGPISAFERGGISQQSKSRAIFNSELFRVYRHEHRLSLVQASAQWVAKVSANKLRAVAPKFYDLIRYRKT